MLTSATDSANAALPDSATSSSDALSLRVGAFFVALCLVPRVLMCVFADSVCPDAFLYFDLAALIERGNLEDALSAGMNLNIYPFILAALHHCGLDWVVAGRVWNLVVMSLTVLPLYGWMRRVTDGRTAALGCLIYAVWPVMTEIAAQPIRDPTFWLLMNLTFYLGLTTVERPTLGRCLLTVVVWVAAIFTRMEAWLLLLPVCWWAANRAFESPEARRVLLRASGYCIVAVLLLAAVVNLTVGRLTGKWITGRVETALPGIPWLHNLLHGKPVGAEVVSHIEPTTLHSFMQNFSEGLDLLNLSALILGLVYGRHLFRNRTMQPLLAHAAIMLLAIWCRIPDQRYFCQVYFVLMPFIAIGGIQFIESVGNWLSMRTGRELRRQWAVAWLCVFATINIVDAVATWHPHFVSNHRLAEWYQQQFRVGTPVLTDRFSIPARFFMSGPQPGLPHFNSNNAISLLDTQNPAVVVYSHPENSTDARAVMSAALTDHGFTRVGADETGVLENSFVVWVNRQSLARHASHAPVRTATRDDL